MLVKQNNFIGIKHNLMEVKLSKHFLSALWAYRPPKSKEFMINLEKTFCWPLAILE